MIAFLIYIFVLWLLWRWLCRSMATYVEIAPPPPPPVTITINVYIKDVHVTAGRIAPEKQKPRPSFD